MKKLNRYRNHTPGSWYVTEEKEEGVPIAIIPSEQATFYVYSTEDVEPGEPIANVQLIRSARSLLRATKLAIAMIEHPPDSVRLKESYMSKLRNYAKLAELNQLCIQTPKDNASD